jgi:hypothetical protein
MMRLRNTDLYFENVYGEDGKLCSFFVVYKSVYFAHRSRSRMGFQLRKVLQLRLRNTGINRVSVEITCWLLVVRFFHFLVL